MNYKLRMAAFAAAAVYLVSIFSGCSTPRTKYAEDGVDVATINAQASLVIPPERIVVVGRIQVVEKNGLPVDPSSDLAIYILRDLSAPNGSLPDWSASQLALLETKPFATDRNGYFRITLPRGRYYPQLIYRKKDLGIFSINPNVRMDFSDVKSIAYAGTLALRIDGQRLDELRKIGAFKDMLVEGAASQVIVDDLAKDRQQLEEGLATPRQDLDSKHLLAAVPGSAPNVLTSEAILTTDQKVSRATKILLQSAALIILIPLMIMSGAAGGTIDFSR